MMNHKAGRDETHGKNDTNGVEQTLSDLPSEKINEREREEMLRDSQQFLVQLALSVVHRLVD